MVSLGFFAAEAQRTQRKDIRDAKLKIRFFVSAFSAYSAVK